MLKQRQTNDSNVHESESYNGPQAKRKRKKPELEKENLRIGKIKRSKKKD